MRSLFRMHHLYSFGLADDASQDFVPSSPNNCKRIMFQRCLKSLGSQSSFYVTARQHTMTEVFTRFHAFIPFLSTILTMHYLTYFVTHELL